MAGASEPAWRRLARETGLAIIQDPVQIATEAAQWGSIHAHRFLQDAVVLSDDGALQDHARRQKLGGALVDTDSEDYDRSGRSVSGRNSDLAVLGRPRCERRRRRRQHWPTALWASPLAEAAVDDGICRKFSWRKCDPALVRHIYDLHLMRDLINHDAVASATPTRQKNSAT
jgi:hypothetical protein